MNSSGGRLQHHLSMARRSVGYFTSNRPAEKGQDDIWRFYVPDMVFALQGTAVDKETGEPLPDAKIRSGGYGWQQLQRHHR
jgi:hypothetical protein